MAGVSREDVVELLGFLSRYANRPLPESSHGPYLNALVGMDRDALLEAGRRWVETHGPGSFLPSVEDLRQLVREARLGRWQTFKDRDSRTPLRDFQRGASKGMAREVATLIAKRLTGAITWQAYIAGLRALDHRYPESSFRTPRDPEQKGPQNFAEAAEQLERLRERDVYATALRERMQRSLLPAPEDT